MTRKFALSISNRMGRQKTDGISWHQAAMAVPDAGGHCDIEGDTTWGALQAAFGMHPLMISCWCCLLAAVPKDHQHLFRDTTVNLPAFGRQMAAKNGVAPSPVALAHGYTGGA